MRFYVAEQPMWVVVEGADAARVVNNLCTADITTLSENESTECFVTDVRGRVVAFAICHVSGETVSMLGTHPDPQAVADHIDRYIIREAAQVKNLSEGAEIVASDCQPPEIEEAVIVPARILPDGWMMGIARTALPAVEKQLADKDFERLTQEQAELRRIEAFWPKNGIEIGEKSLPQELDRDCVAISFTKGCYLGQETVARLDARGQLQKKLCMVGSDSELTVGGELTDGDKVVGKIYSAAKRSDGQWLALANMRRGYFDAGTAVQTGAGIAKVQATPSLNA